jgi:hypothetical protein
MLSMNPNVDVGTGADRCQRFAKKNALIARVWQRHFYSRFSESVHCQLSAFSHRVGIDPRIVTPRPCAMHSDAGRFLSNCLV